jgi:excisionase family DNA binding protein
MLLTIKDLSAWLNIKPSTLYVWASHGKIPCHRIHGLIRFDPHEIGAWLKGFSGSSYPRLSLERREVLDVDRLIEGAKRAAARPSLVDELFVRREAGQTIH